MTYVTLTHSIPEPNALAIRTPAGVVLHTGDWKIDPDPQIGSTTDVEGLTALGDEGVLAMVCEFDALATCCRNCPQGWPPQQAVPRASGFSVQAL